MRGTEPEETARQQFVRALNNACGEIDEAARLSKELFAPDDLKIVRRELGRLMGIIDGEILARLSKVEEPGS